MVSCYCCILSSFINFKVGKIIMIYLYSGTPGSGKSLHLSQIIRSDNNHKRFIVSNMIINKDLLKHPDLYFYFYDEQLTPSLLIDISKNYFKNKVVHEGEITLIIDESQRLFNSRDWGKSNRKEWNDFFSLHRHYGYDIILVAQFDRMLDRQIRCLIEYEQIHRKLVNFGWKGIFLSLLLFSPKLFCHVKYWYPMKEKISCTFFRFSKKSSRLYDTFSNDFL